MMSMRSALQEDATAYIEVRSASTAFSKPLRRSPPSNASSRVANLRMDLPVIHDLQFLP